MAAVAIFIIITLIALLVRRYYYSSSRSPNRGIVNPAYAPTAAVIDPKPLTKVHSDSKAPPYTVPSKEVLPVFYEPIPPAVALRRVDAPPSYRSSSDLADTPRSEPYAAGSRVRRGSPLVHSTTSVADLPPASARRPASSRAVRFSHDNGEHFA